jgi:ATP-dependent Clp protease ATP-binding subunit ClpB
MDANRLTETALQLVASAQQIAQTRRHASVTPLHLARALLADAEQPPARVLQRAGGDLGQAHAALDAALQREPTVSGGSGELYMAAETGRALEAADALAKAWGDAFVAADTLLVALRRGAGERARACSRRPRPSKRAARRSGPARRSTRAPPSRSSRRSTSTAST